MRSGMLYQISVNP